MQPDKEAESLEERNLPRYVISVAARLAAVTPAQLRSFERAGLLTPARTDGRLRLYSNADLDRARRIAELRARGVNLAGIEVILEMEGEEGESGTEQPISDDGKARTS